MALQFSVDIKSSPCFRSLTNHYPSNDTLGKMKIYSITDREASNMLDVDCLRPYLPGNTTCHSPEKAGVMLMEITTNDRSYFDKCRRREAQLTRPVGRVTTGQSPPPPKEELSRRTRSPPKPLHWFVLMHCTFGRAVLILAADRLSSTMTVPSVKSMLIPWHNGEFPTRMQQATWL